MKLSDVIKVWDHLHTNDVGTVGFAELEMAIDLVVGIENDCLPQETYQARSEPTHVLSSVRAA